MAQQIANTLSNVQKVITNSIMTLHDISDELLTQANCIQQARVSLTLAAEQTEKEPK